MWELDLPRPKLIVLQAMAGYANDDGTSCHPSIDRIAYETSYKPRQTIEYVRQLRKEEILIMVAPARQHRPAEYEIHLENAPKKPPFDEWRKEHGRHARGAAANASLKEEPKKVPEVHSRGSGVHSHGSGVQFGGSRGAVASAPEPVEPLDYSSNESSVGDQGPPAASDLIALFFDSLEEVRATRSTNTHRRPIPKTGPHCRGSFASDVARELEGGRDPLLIEQAVMRRALRWDDFPMDLPRALNDVLDGKPWTVEGERNGHRPRRPLHQRSGALVGATSGRTMADDFIEEDF